MIKYKVISKKEKDLPKPKPAVYSGQASYPQTQEYLNTEIAKAMANGFVVGATVVRKSFPTAPMVITAIQSDIAQVYGAQKPFFMVLDNVTVKYHPDELILVEDDKDDSLRGVC